MLHQAQAQGFALPACRVTDLNTLDAALRAADQCDAPLVLQVDAASAGPPGLTLLLAAIEAAAADSVLPLAILLDQARSRAEAIEAIRLGCTGLLLEADAAELAAAVEMARGCDIPLGGRWDPDRDADAAAGLDFLALEAAAATRIRPDRTRQRPLLVGDASGQEPAPLVQQGLALLGMGLAVSTAQIGDWIRGCGAADKAAGLRRACPLMQPVEHLIIYNLSLEAEPRAAEIMAQGRKVLSQIPGVRRVLTGTALKQDAQFQLCWLVRFTGPSVIASYRDHPLHVEYADTWFRPYAADRISIDYLL